MSTKTAYRVQAGTKEHVVMSIAEVCDLLGLKQGTLSKKDVVKGKVPGVVAFEGNIEELATAADTTLPEDTSADLPGDAVAEDYTPDADPDEPSTEHEEGLDAFHHESDTSDGLVYQDEDTQVSTDKDDEPQVPTTNGVNPELLAKLRAMSAAKLATKDSGKGKKGGKASNEPVEYPERGSVKDEKELKKLYKKLTDAQIDEWMTLEGVTYSPCAHEAINRMRKCMALTAVYFPKEGSSKKKSKYADFSTEQLAEMAVEHDVAVKDDKGDPRILRMYLIMALREAGIIE